MFDKALLQFTKPWVDRGARQLLQWGLKPDHLTFIGFASGMVAALFLATGHPLLAIKSIIISRLCDGLDGAMARMSNTQNDRGAFLDIALDFVFYASVPLAFAVANPAQNALPAAVLLAAFVITGTSFLAYATLAAKRGEKSSDYPTKGIYYLGGLTEGSETIALFMACCLWPNAFPVLAYLYAVLCALTTFTRVMAGYKNFGR